MATSFWVCRYTYASQIRVCTYSAYVHPALMCQNDLLVVSDVFKSHQKVLQLQA